MSTSPVGSIGELPICHDSVDADAKACGNHLRKMHNESPVLGLGDAAVHRKPSNKNKNTASPSSPTARSTSNLQDSWYSDSPVGPSTPMSPAVPTTPTSPAFTIQDIFVPSRFR